MREGAHGQLRLCVSVRRNGPRRRDKTKVGETLQGGRPCCGVAMVNLPPKSTTQNETIRTGQKNLHEAQLWRSRLGYPPGGRAPSSPENTNDGEEIDPGTTLPVSPRLSVGRTCPPARAKNIRIGRRNRTAAPAIYLAELPPWAGIKTAGATRSNQVSPRERRLRYLSGGTLSFRRDADIWSRHDWATTPFTQSRVGFLFAGIDP